MGNAQSQEPVLLSDNVPSCTSTTGTCAENAVTRSSLTRTRSVHSNADHLQQQEGEAVSNYRCNNTNGLNRLDLHHRPSETRYLPRGLDKAHNGIIMPKLPHSMDHYHYPYQNTTTTTTTTTGSSLPPVPPSASSVDGEIESPQWGWFLRTTPPTPQMYQSHSKHPSTGDSSLASTGTASSTSTVPTAHPNPVFQGLQDNTRHAMDWSGVPL